jgi:hypothetical protein
VGSSAENRDVEKRLGARLNGGAGADPSPAGSLDSCSSSDENKDVENRFGSCVNDKLSAFTAGGHGACWACWSDEEGFSPTADRTGKYSALSLSIAISNAIWSKSTESWSERYGMMALQ